MARTCVVLTAVMIGFALWGIAASLDCVATQDKAEEQKKLKKIKKQEMLEEIAREEGEIEKVLPADLIDLQLKEAPLSKLLEMLESTYSIKFKIETNIDDLKVSLTVRNLSLPAVIKLIAEACNLDYRVRNNGTIVLSNSQDISVSQEKTKEQKEFKKELPEELIDLNLKDWDKTKERKELEKRLPEELVTLKVKDEPISVLLWLLGDQFGVKFSIEANIENKKVSLDVNQVPLSDVINIITEASNLKYRVRDDGVVVIY